MICPVKYSNNVKIIENERKIEVNEKKCIACGKCLKICDHDARNYTDDIETFLEDLAKGEKITIIVAPSFVTNKPNLYKKVLGYFKSIGIDLLYDVSFGADISTWGYIEYFKNRNTQDFLISQACPVVINYIEKFTPNLIKNLIPVQGPAICTAIYLKKYQQIKNKIAFISPCIAKKSEIVRGANIGLIDYNITFENLFKYFSENDINLENYPEVEFDNKQAGLGVKFSRIGGLSENLLYHLPELQIRQLRNPENVYGYLKLLNKGFRSGAYDFLDIVNCGNGCNVGTAANRENINEEVSIDIEEEILGQKRFKIQNEIDINYEEYDKFFEYLSQNFKLEDFLIEYKDRSDEIKTIQPSEVEFEEAFLMLKKYDSESRKINCYSCGYKTCKDMAIAIHNNYNVPSSCHQFNRKELEIQRDISDYIRTILEYMTRAIIVTDENGYIKFVNKEIQKLLGFTTDEFLYKHIQYFFNNLDLDELKKVSTNIYKTARKSGNLCHVQIEARDFILKEKLYILFVLEDITRQIEMDTLKNNFISMVSHELRTPLTSIKGALGLVVSGSIGEMPEKSKDLLNIANNNVVRLINLINEILDMEKLTAGKMNFNFNEYSIMSLVEESILSNNTFAEQYNVKYEITERLEKALVNIDKNKFIQIMTNLLSNAVKFSFPNETIEICVKRVKHLVTVEITNKGQGIPEDCQSRIFESFYQADSNSESLKSGSGLGLSICKSLVENMGGSIGFHSVVNDKTTFYFRFPEIYEKQEKKSVLIIEDEKIASTKIKTMFQRLNYKVDTAMTAKDATVLLNSNEYDLITLDIFLPDKNGLELLDEIRSNELTNDLPIIIISGSTEAMAKAVGNKIIALLEKSFDFEKLKETITEITLKKNQSKIKILHVENDVDILNITRENLKEIANIKPATSISEAEGILTDSAFDIIILDYKLPDGKCDKLINTIKNSQSKNAKFIIFSAYEECECLINQVDLIILKTKVTNEQFCDSIKKFICIKERNIS